MNSFPADLVVSATQTQVELTKTPFCASARRGWLHRVIQQGGITLQHQLTLLSCAAHTRPALPKSCIQSGHISLHPQD